MYSFPSTSHIREPAVRSAVIGYSISFVERRNPTVARLSAAPLWMLLLLIAVFAIVDQPSRMQALEIWYRIPLGTAFFWFIFGPLWQLVFFKRESSAT